MIAAVSPTSASSRNGTPAPRSDSASRPPARLYGTTTCIQFRGGSAGQTRSVQAEYRGDTLGADRSGPQNARLRPGEVQDRRGGLLRGRTGVEIDVDEVAELPACVVGVYGRRGAGDVGAGYSHRPDPT